MQRGSERGPDQLAALIIRTVWLSPDAYTTPTLAHALGEGERRIQRTLRAIERGGWDVERGADYRLTVRPAVIISTEG